jgi:hypothetical protein
VNASVDPLSHALGRIEGALETITKTLSEDRMASASYRTQMRGDLTTVREMVHDLRNRVNNNAEDIDEMKADVSDYRITKAQGVGVWNVAKTLWTLIISLSAAGIGAIIHAFWPAASK